MRAQRAKFLTFFYDISNIDDMTIFFFSPEQKKNIVDMLGRRLPYKITKGSVIFFSLGEKNKNKTIWDF